MDIKYGLIVINPKEKGETFEVLHFCGYLEQPSIEDVEHLREELRDDPEFGLQDIWEQIEILPAPKRLVEEYGKMITENK